MGMSSLIGQATGMGNKNPAGYTTGRIQNFTPEQIQLFQRMFGSVSPDSFTSRLAQGDQSAFDESEAPALRQFAGLQGQTASRFSQLAPGAMSSRRGSGFHNAINQQTSDFAQDLASKRMGLQRQAIMDLHGMSQDLLSQRPYENYLVQQQHKPSFLSQVAPAIGAGVGGAFGGVPGAQLGASVGSGFSRAGY